ncbi:MAG: flagellar motor switch protein FliM [Acidobacteria bacterium]|nr:flagellar motor switch protein FliM [Acidobacteriota bacterium]
MSRILSQDEIDALLAAASEVQAEPAPEPARGAAGESIIRYNFRRPDRVSKEQIHSLHFLHDRFARNVGTSLSAYLRAITELSVVSVEQFSYSEFLMSLTDPTAFYALAIPPFDELGALEINPQLAFTMVDRMLGGSGGLGSIPNRALSDIEQNVVDSVVKLLLDALAETWRPIVNLAFGIRGRETRPQMLQVAAPNEIVIMVVFDAKIGETRGMMNLGIPASIVESTGAHFVQAWHRQRREPTDVERRWMRDNLLRVPIDLTASIETRLSARTLLALEPGHVLALDVGAGGSIDVRAGGAAKFQGRLAATSGRVGVRIEGRCDAFAPGER